MNNEFYPMHCKIHNISGWYGAIMGMRYPKNSEDKSDSIFDENLNLVKLGEADKDLMIRLTKAGRDHSKFLRMIHVQASLNMTFQFYKQFDTYKIGTTANSRSTMHKFGVCDLSVEKDFYTRNGKDHLRPIVNEINSLINIYKMKKQNNDKDCMIYWHTALEMLPISFCQERMIDLNYEVLLGMSSRFTEKLNIEWNFILQSYIDACPLLKEFFDCRKKQMSMSTEEFERKKN